MNKVFIRLIFILLIGLGVVFSLHLTILYFLKLPLFDNAIMLAYGLNLLLAIFIFGMIFKLKKSYKEQLGFVFMLGSLLKFLVFFVVFFPGYKADGDITRVEVATFFVPYVTCLVLEFPDLIKLVQNKA